VNKQEALEALLTVCRKFERPDGTPKTPHVTIMDELASLISSLDVILQTPVSHRRDVQLRQTLGAIGGRVVYLLVDEVEPVVGKELDDWLKEKEGGTVVKSPASYTPAAINGLTIVQPSSRLDVGLLQEAYAKGLREGRSGG